MRWTVKLFVVGALAMSPAPKAANAADRDDSFDFATMHTPAWALTATTNVVWDGSPAARYATVASLECEGESEQFHFSMNSVGEVVWLGARFLGKADKDGEREEMTLLGDRLWLYIDGERWEFANIPTHSRQFSNVPYPPPESDIVLSVWHGYQAVRRSDDQPWINLRLIYHRLIIAKKIEWSFKSRDWASVEGGTAANQRPRNWNATRYRVDNVGLNAAILWCARQVASEEAYILPTRMLERGRSTGGG